MVMEKKMLLVALNVDEISCEITHLRNVEFSKYIIVNTTH